MFGPRKRLTCWICSKRKVKCDKQVPCSNCVRRGTASECESDPSVERSIVAPEIHQQQSRDESNTIDVLRERITELECALRRNTPESSTARRPPDDHVSHDHQGSQAPSVQSHDSEVEDAATILEFLTWGRMKDPEKTRPSGSTFISPELDKQQVDSSCEDSIDLYLDTKRSILSWLQLLLPSRRQLTQLVEYHNEYLLWFHGSYFVPSLLKQIETFYRDYHGNISSPGANLQWVALLFAVLAGTMTSAPPAVSRKWRFEENEARVLSQKWYKAVISSLNAADYTANHSLYSVQAIATLTSTAHILGHSNSQSVMLASAIRIAQSLGLHRLDEDARGDDIEIETGRRLWAQLCTQDWFSTSFSETYSIHPLHSTSLSPKNCGDDLRVMPDSTPTITSFCRFLAEAAFIMPGLQDGMASSNTLYTKYEQVLLYDKKIRSLATGGRPPFLSNTELDESWPCYIPWARRAIAMSFAHKIIMIHRKFLSLSFTDPAFTFTRRTCLAASRTILKEYISIGSDPSSPTLWTHQAFSVAACIIMCLDLLHQPSTTIERQPELVTQTIETLARGQHRSMIASRGVKLLTALQNQIIETTGGRKRRSDDVDEITPRKKQRGFDVVAFARNFSNNDTLVPPLPKASLGAPHDLVGAIHETTEDANGIPVINDNPTSDVTLDMSGFWDSSTTDFNYNQSFENLLYLATQDVQ